MCGKLHIHLGITTVYKSNPLQAEDLELKKNLTPIVEKNIYTMQPIKR